MFHGRFKIISLNDSGWGAVGYRWCCAGFRQWKLVGGFLAGGGAGPMCSGWHRLLAAAVRPASTRLTSHPVP